MREMRMLKIKKATRDLIYNLKKKDYTDQIRIATATLSDLTSLLVSYVVTDGDNMKYRFEEINASIAILQEFIDDLLAREKYSDFYWETFPSRHFFFTCSSCKETSFIKLSGQIETTDLFDMKVTCPCCGVVKEQELNNQAKYKEWKEREEKKEAKRAAKAAEKELQAKIDAGVAEALAAQDKTTEA